VFIEARYATLKLAATRNRRPVILVSIVKLHTDRDPWSCGYPPIIERKTRPTSGAGRIERITF